MASEDPDRPGPDPDEPLGLTLERRPRDERRPRRRWGWPLAALAGVAVVAVGGVVFVAAEQANRRDEAAVKAAGPQLQVDASALPPAPLPQAALDAPKLQVLPDLPPTPLAPPASDFAGPTDEPATPQIVEPAPAEQSAPAQAAERGADQPDCRAAPGLAEAMVCADPDLAAADRRMRAAYVAALRAGAPPDLLGRDQDAWLASREEAAQWSRRALAEAYRRRIAELRDIAENGW